MASTALEEKINKIRQKNEEIRRRHEEVEADKQNAAKLNALVKMIPPTDWPERKEPPEFSNPPSTARSNGNSKPKLSSREHRGQQQQYHAGGGDGKKIHVFAEGDGPPPDPSYNFLADSEREERTRDDSRDNERFRGRGGSLRGSFRKRGGGREGHSKEYRGSFAGPKDTSKPEYEAWRAERNRIDEARISRQRTAEGNWRREWDSNKINVDEDEVRGPKASWSESGDAVKKDYKEFSKWQVDGNDQDSSPRGRGGKQHTSRGALRGSHNNRVYQHSNSFEQYHGSVSPSATKAPLSPNGVDERTVVATDKSIKVIVNHGTTPPKGPVMSVKVSSSSIAGTGRVGPRQKPRILYSSQSESETSSHEHDKFSSYKSPDDKTNRVYFNQDIEEQQRFVPKSPHPHRRGENNLKSPYSPRKEFKYDTQQQKLGETDIKVPYQPRRDAKDCPKSPHFNKRAEFSNRDSHDKQKNSVSGTDSFKSNQKRMLEKTKHDSPKTSVTKKSEEIHAPKPQRIKKRTDKSKSFQHNNSKETQESCNNERTVQSNNFGTATTEESTTNQIPDGNENVSEFNNTINSCKKDSSADTMTVEKAQEIQNEDSIVSETKMDLEDVSPSIDSLRDSKSIPNDIKSAETSDLADNSEPIVPRSVSAEFEGKKDIRNIDCEIETVNDSAILHSDESKTSDCHQSIKEVEIINTLPEFQNTVQEKVEIQLLNSNSTLEIKDVQELSNNELQQEQLNSTSLEKSSTEKVERESITVISDLQYQTKDETSHKPELIINEISQAENKKEITDVEKELPSSLKLDAQSKEEKDLNDVNNQIVKDSENKESSVI